MGARLGGVVPAAIALEAAAGAIQRTDEAGNAVGYDYGSGEWADGWTPDDDRRDDIGDEDADGDPVTPGVNRD